MLRYILYLYSMGHGRSSCLLNGRRKRSNRGAYRKVISLKGLEESLEEKERKYEDNQKNSIWKFRLLPGL